MFGPHLLIDGSRCNAQKLGDRLLIERLLSDYPAAIGMTKIGGPYLFEYQAPDPAYSGVSGIVVIAESHIALHTFPALDYFTLDIFSCKTFDHEAAIRYVRDALEVGQMDRMLVQRGLGFRGPHHGAAGATDELIAAAEARLAAGIVSNETVSPADLAANRAQRVAARAATPDPADADATLPAVAGNAGRMIWPEYGVTPDVGTYGTAAALPRAPSFPHVPSAPSRRATAAAEPVQLNPTASISGLLDKLSGVGLGGRAASRALDTWERLARDPECAIVLALSTPVIAAGLRELVAATTERRYVDIVVASGGDLFADLYESLGYVHFADDGAVVAVPEDRARTTTFLTTFVAELTASRAVGAGPMAGSDLLRALGEALPARAPRKGLIQAAATTGVPIYVPDLAAGEFGAALLGARAQGHALAFDALADLAGLSHRLASQSRIGTVVVGTGVADAFLAQAQLVAAETAPVTAGGVRICAGDSVPPVDGTVSSAADPTLLLPLLISGLAQRVPSTRGLRARREQSAASAVSTPTEHPEERAVV
jgi:S-adenosylmethionine decarboxylase